MPARADIERTLGTELTEQFLAGETEVIWARMTTEMQDAMGGAENLAGFRQQLLSQAGAPGPVVSEEWSEAQGFDVFQRVQKFEKSPRPLIIQWAFDADEQVAGFFIQPVQGEPSTAFDDYQTKTELHLPFEGEWFVYWGGRERSQNYHVDYSNQRFAYDILVMRDGKSFTGDPKSLQSYYCFGREILAPAAGTVVVALDGLPDQVPGEMDPQHPPGNHVIIDHGNEEYSLLAHLQQGTVEVAVGDEVETGTLLGRCGNSGNTSEPHVHYHLQNADTFGKGHGLPAPFTAFMADGEFVESGEPLKGQFITPEEAGSE